MCHILNSEPIEEEIPVERGDLTYETQLIFTLYDILPARWEGFSGTYMGKDLSPLNVLIDQYSLSRSEVGYLWTIMPIIDNFVAEDIARKIKTKTKVGDVPRGS